MPIVKVELRDAGQPRPRPEGVNYFGLTKVGMEFEMLVGYVDIQRLTEGAGGFAGRDDDEVLDIVVGPELTHRFLLSPMGFENLRNVVHEIEQQMPKGPSGGGKRKQK